MNRGIVFILFAALLGCGGDASTDNGTDSGEETGEAGASETGVDAVEDVEVGEESIGGLSMASSTFTFT